MNKEYVLGLLRTTWNNYVVGCLAVFLLTNTDSNNIPNKLELENLKFPEAQVLLDLQPMKSMLISKEKTKKLLNEHMKSILRSFIKDIFEIVKFYANGTNQFDELKNANWFEFTRVIRNCLAHDFRIRFKEKEKKILPVKWRDKEITIDMDGQPLPVQIMNEAYAILLFNDIFQYVVTKLE